MRGEGVSSFTLQQVVAAQQEHRKTCSTRNALTPLASRTRNTVLSRDAVARLMVGKYKTTHKGIPLLKDVVSRHLYEELILKVTPAAIIDLGTAFGGSAAWFAHITPPHTQIVTLDLEDLRQTQSTVKKVTFHQVDLDDAAAVARVLCHVPHPWIVSEDCHLPADRLMRALDPLMQAGDYIVFEDTHPGNPDASGMSAESEEYRCEHWSTAKLNTVESEMLKRPAYMIDAHIQDFYGYNGCTHINSIFCKTA